MVQLNLSQDASKSTEEFRAFARTYFKDFKKTKQGMMRLDPQDAGQCGAGRASLLQNFGCAGAAGDLSRQAARFVTASGAWVILHRRSAAFKNFNKYENERPPCRFFCFLVFPIENCRRWWIHA